MACLLDGWMDGWLVDWLVEWLVDGGKWVGGVKKGGREDERTSGRGS